jgi:hypothetical protein
MNVTRNTTVLSLALFTVSTSNGSMFGDVC